MRNIALDNYSLVQGPLALRESLDKLLEQAKLDSAFAAEPHIIKYQLGAQESLIKVDLSEQPYLFWYGDMQERTVTKAVQHVIADFLWEKGGLKEKITKALLESDISSSSDKNMFQKTDSSISKSGLGLFGGLFQKSAKPEVSPEALEVARQAFRDQSVKGFITDVNNRDIHNKAVFTITERQGELVSRQELINRITEAKRQALPGIRPKV